MTFTTIHFDLSNAGWKKINSNMFVKSKLKDNEGLEMFACFKQGRLKFKGRDYKRTCKAINYAALVGLHKYILCLLD